MVQNTHEEKKEKTVEEKKEVKEEKEEIKEESVAEEKEAQEEVAEEDADADVWRGADKRRIAGADGNGEAAKRRKKSRRRRSVVVVVGGGGDRAERRGQGADGAKTRRFRRGSLDSGVDNRRCPAGPSPWPGSASCTTCPGRSGPSRPPTRCGTTRSCPRSSRSSRAACSRPRLTRFWERRFSIHISKLTRFRS